MGKQSARHHGLGKFGDQGEVAWGGDRFEAHVTESEKTLTREEKYQLGSNISSGLWQKESAIFIDYPN